MNYVPFECRTEAYFLWSKLRLKDMADVDGTKEGVPFRTKL